MTTPLISTVPAVLDALVALTARVAPGVQVIDSQPLEVEQDFIAIGFDEDGADAVEVVQTTGQLKGPRDREQYNVACLISAWSGDTDPKPVRDRAFELAGLLNGGLKADPRLGGLVMNVRLSLTALSQTQDEKGATATLRVSLRVDAFTAR